MIKEIQSTNNDLIIIHDSNKSFKSDSALCNKIIFIEQFNKNDIQNVIDNLKFLYSVSSYYTNYAFCILTRHSKISVYKLLI